MNNKKNTFALLRRLFAICMNFRSWFVIALLVSIMLSLVSTYRPYLSMKIIDEDIIKYKDKQQVLLSVGLFTGLVVIEATLNYLLVYFSNFISQNVIKHIREKLFQKMIFFKTSFFDKTPIGQLVTRAVSDVETISTIYTDGFLMVFGDILRIVFVLVMMFAVNPHLSAIAIFILPLMIVVTRLFQRKLKKAFSDERNFISVQNSFVQERLSGMSIIQVFRRENVEFKKFVEINKTLKSALLRTVFIFSLFFPTVELVSSIFIGLVFVYSGYITITAGEVIAFVQFIHMLIRPLRQMADRFNNIQRGIVGADRVFSLMDEDLTIANEGKYIPTNLKGKIEFKNVYFSYDEKQEVLKNVSFVVNEGETTAIVGATGAGKSTIINLIPRLYEINKGQILIDDIDIKDYELQSLRKNIVVVLQDVFLFYGTIYENLSFGDKSITIDRVKEAAREIEIDKFIEQLPNGYNFVVSERGSSISLGQRQLLSFLRAYLLNPKILILDEATSSIDIESEKLIQKATEKITKNRTAIIIAHRKTTIENADKIIIMDKGSVISKSK